MNNAGTITNSGSGTGTSIISEVIGSNVTNIIQNSADSGLTISGANTAYTGGVTIDAGTVTGSTSASAFGMAQLQWEIAQVEAVRRHY